MGRYFRVTTPRYNDFLYKAPLEYMYKAAMQMREEQKKFDKTLYDLSDVFSGLTTFEEWKPLMRQKISKYIGVINDAVSTIHATPADYSSKTNMLRKISSSIKRELVDGDLAFMHNSYKEYMRKYKELKKDKNLDPAFVDRAAALFREDLKNSPYVYNKETGENSLPRWRFLAKNFDHIGYLKDVIDPKNFEKNREMWLSNGIKRVGGNLVFVGTNTIVTDKEAMRIAARDALVNNQDFINYNRMLVDLGMTSANIERNLADRLDSIMMTSVYDLYPDIDNLKPEEQKIVKKQFEDYKAGMIRKIESIKNSLTGDPVIDYSIYRANNIADNVSTIFGEREKIKESIKFAKDYDHLSPLDRSLLALRKAQIEKMKLEAEDLKFNLRLRTLGAAIPSTDIKATHPTGIDPNEKNPVDVLKTSIDEIGKEMDQLSLRSRGTTMTDDDWARLNALRAAYKEKTDLLEYIEDAKKEVERNEVSKAFGVIGGDLDELVKAANLLNGRYKPGFLDRTLGSWWQKAEEDLGREGININRLLKRLNGGKEINDKDLPRYKKDLIKRLYNVGEILEEKRSNVEREVFRDIETSSVRNDQKILFPSKVLQKDNKKGSFRMVMNPATMQTTTMIKSTIASNPDAVEIVDEEGNIIDPIEFASMNTIVFSTDYNSGSEYVFRDMNSSKMTKVGDDGSVQEVKSVTYGKHKYTVRIKDESVRKGIIQNVEGVGNPLIEDWKNMQLSTPPAMLEVSNIVESVPKMNSRPGRKFAPGKTLPAATWVTIQRETGHMNDNSAEYKITDGRNEYVMRGKDLAKAIASAIMIGEHDRNVAIQVDRDAFVTMRLNEKTHQMEPVILRDAGGQYMDVTSQYIQKKIK